MEEQLSLFDKVEEVKKEKVKRRKGVITINLLDSKENPYSVDFWGFNEGSGFPCKDENEVNRKVEYLTQTYCEFYKLEVKDLRKRQEADKIYF